LVLSCTTDMYYDLGARIDNASDYGESPCKVRLRSAMREIPEVDIVCEEKPNERMTASG